MSNNSQVSGTEIACELLLKVIKRIRDQTFRLLKTQDFKNHSIRSQGRRNRLLTLILKSQTHSARILCLAFVSGVII